MAKRKEDERILDVNATMQGTLVFSDPVHLRISGRFEGTLKTKGVLSVGEEAHVIADLDGEKITISGYVKGKVHASQLVALTSSAHVQGDIETYRFSIEEGAVFNGRCKMKGERIDIRDLSDYLSVEQEKIMEWVNAGKIPVDREDNTLLFDPKEVEAWIGQNR